jgi:hypothetical protein
MSETTRSRPDSGAQVVTLMAELVLAMDHGDLAHAARIQGRLDRLGWTVRPRGGRPA